MLGGDRGKMKVAVCCPYLLDSLVEQLVQDLTECDIEIHLWALQSVLPGVAQFTRGTGRLGKAQALNRLLPYVSNADLVLFIDDDVRLGPRFISTYLSIVTALGAAVAQPALTANSHYSHSITLQRPGRWARLTNFVESGPVVSMTREFLDLVTPFPESSRMGWGLDVQWSAIAQAHGFRMAIVDACPVEHTFRPVGAHYDRAEAWKDMERFLAEHRLTWPCHRVLREYPRICERPSEYLAAFPAPAEAVQHGLHSDAALDLPLLWAVASLVQPELIVELGTRRGMSTRTLVHAARRWGGRVITVDPVDAKPYLADVPCEFVQKTGEDLFCTWSTPVKFLFIDTDPHSYQQTRHWLDTWVKTWLADGGVAVFHDVVTTRPEVQVAQAVRDWLREQPPIWHWQEFAGTSGLGLLWRVGDRPDFEGLLAGSTGQVPHPEKNQREGVRQGAAAVTRPRGQLRASIVIASLNEGDRLWKTVQSCIETVEELDGSYEVVIADDASDDSSIEALRQRFPHIRVFAHAERRGVSPTKDLGARSSCGAVLVFLDGHCKPEPGAIARLIADVEALDGQAIVTPRVAALDAERWQNNMGQVGHGYRMDLERFDVSWIGLGQMEVFSASAGRRFYESPALIGCCAAMSRDLYEQLWGFDPGMRVYGVEDIDFGLKAWLMGYPVLHDPEPVIGHRFRASFDNYSVPMEHILVNQLRMARKNFSDPVWDEWVRQCKARQPDWLWELAWKIFTEGRESVERERAYLLTHRVHDEFWYAARFGLPWPKRTGVPGETADPVSQFRSVSSTTAGLRWSAQPDSFLEHYRRPRNQQVLPNPDAVGIARSDKGAMLTLYLQLSAAGAGAVRVERATFQGERCGVAVAYASALTEMIRGWSLEEVRALCPDDLRNRFGTEVGATESVKLVFSALQQALS